MAMWQNLWEELLLMIFEQLSYGHLTKVVLVCRSWSDIGEALTLWSSLPVIVKTGNMSLMPEILSSARMQGLKKLIIEAPNKHWQSYPTKVTR